MQLDGGGGGGATRNSAETQPSGRKSRFESEVKNERISTKDGTQERLRCGTIQREVN